MSSALHAALFALGAAAKLKAKAKAVAFVITFVPGANYEIVEAVRVGTVNLAAGAHGLRLISGDDLAKALEGDPSQAVAACAGDLPCLATVGKVSGSHEVCVAEVQHDGTVRFLVISTADAVMLGNIEMAIEDPDDVEEKLAAVFADVFGVAPGAGMGAALEELPVPDLTAPTAPPPPPPAAPQAGAGPGALLWVGVATLAAGAGAGGAGVYFGLQGKATLDSITPSTSQVDTDVRGRSVDNDFLLANILFGGAAAAGVAGGVMVILSLARAGGDAAPATADAGPAVSLGSDGRSLLLAGRW